MVDTQLHTQQNMQEMSKDPIINSMKPPEQQQLLQVRQWIGGPKEVTANQTEQGYHLQQAKQGEQEEGTSTMGSLRKNQNVNRLRQ